MPYSRISSYKDDTKKIGDFDKNGYTVSQTPRDRKNGGRNMSFKEELNVKKIPPPFPLKVWNLWKS